MQDLERQVEALENLKNSLIQFIDELNEVAARYKTGIDTLIEGGLTIQIANNYRETYLQRNLESINGIIQTIENEDIPYINRNLEALHELIERTRAN